MTKFWTLNLAIQQAPIDAFEPDGPVKFRVVAYEGPLGVEPAQPSEVIVLTDAWDTADGAVGQFQRSIMESMTRYEGRMLDRAVERCETDVRLLDARTLDLSGAVRGCKGGDKHDPTWVSTHASGRRGVVPDEQVSAFRPAEVNVPAVRVAPRNGVGESIPGDW